MYEYETLKNLEKVQKEFMEHNPTFLSKEEQVILSDFLKKLVSSNNLGIHVPFQQWKNILKDDRLKTQLELKEGTSSSVESRIKATEELFGVQDLNETKYPIYGFILDDNPFRQMAQDSFDMLYKYGGIVLQLKKENLMHRTTLTVGSSLDFQIYKTKRPMFILEPNICAISPKFQKEFYNKIKSNDLKSDMPGTLKKAALNEAAEKVVKIKINRERYSLTY